MVSEAGWVARRQQDNMIALEIGWRETREDKNVGIYITFNFTTQTKLVSQKPTLSTQFNILHRPGFTLH